MEKKKIFISGGSKGIGLAIARHFYAQDFEVIICARGEAGLEAAKAEMPGLFTYSCDLSDKAAVKALASQLTEDHGKLDVLVNNGGTFVPGKIHEESDEVFETLMSTNLNSAYYLTKALLPYMIAAKQGSIFNMCSVASIMAYPNGGSYSISKYALLGFSKCLREEMKEHNIRVISVMPGAVYTPSWEAAGLPEERFIPASDIAKLIWNAYEMADRTVVEEILVRPALGDI